MCVPCYAQQWQNTTANLVGIQVDQDYFYLQGYLIEDHYYFKLQDVSYIMNSSQKPFMVQWQEADRSIHLYSGHNASAVQPQLAFQEQNLQAVKSDRNVFFNASAITMDAYNIAGYTYFQLQDLARVMDFQVNWDDEKKAISILTKMGSQPISPQEYQKMLGRGMDVDWSKTKTGRETYQEQMVEDFVQAGISHVRIRISDDATEELFASLDQQISDCITHGLIPIIAYQADDFKNHPNEKNLQKVMDWWSAVAERYQDVSYLLSFDLLIEATDELNQNSDALNELYERVTHEIRKTNPERIIIISPRMRSDAAYLSELKIPTEHNQYLMAEWHFYAAGPSKTNEKKLWTTGTEAEKRLILEKIELALAWQEQTGIPTWVGAWMPGNYNDGNDYTIAEQVAFADFMTRSLEAAGIPYAVNSDTKFYHRQTLSWYEEMIPLREEIYGEEMGI